MFPDNNSNLNVQFDQDKVSNSARVYVVESKRKSVLAKFLVAHGFFDEEDTAAMVLVCFAMVFIAAAAYLFYQSISEKPINIPMARKVNSAHQNNAK